MKGDIASVLSEHAHEIQTLDVECRTCGQTVFEYPNVGPHSFNPSDPKMCEWQLRGVMNAHLAEFGEDHDDFKIDVVRSQRVRQFDVDIEVKTGE